MPPTSPNNQTPPVEESQIFTILPQSEEPSANVNTENLNTEEELALGPSVNMNDGSSALQVNSQINEASGVLEVNSELNDRSQPTEPVEQLEESDSRPCTYQYEVYTVQQACESSRLSV